MNALHELPVWSDRHVRVVVEAPKGSGVKLKWNPSLHIFEYGNALPLGMTYPYDWGFVPGTRAPDGDPLDALVLSDCGTFPGVVIACVPIAVLRLDQKAKSGRGRQRNDRLVVTPAHAERWSDRPRPLSLSDRVREEIERFFLSSTFFKHKDPRIRGWAGAGAARELVDEAIVPAESR